MRRHAARHAASNAHRGTGHARASRRRALIRRTALGVAQVRVYDLDEMEGVLIEIGQGLDVEGDDGPHLVERAHLADDPHNGALPPLRTLLDGSLIRRGVYPHLDGDRVRAIVERVLQVGVLLISVCDQAYDGHLVEVLAVDGETIVGAGCRRTLQLLDRARRKRLLVQLLSLGIGSVVIHGEPLALGHVAAPERVSTKVAVAKCLPAAAAELAAHVAAKLAGAIIEAAAVHCWREGLRSVG
mmetsp:Transcript_16033/g.32438  ORF Transcript_16033/g.32438 Transcript_16033/m.32438 type:complete len:242 (-) Transcript_16033:5-730(-)